MEWTWLDNWIVVIAALSAMSCALLGNFLVLRRMSMMGDAISHAVLPGLAIAFLLTGSRSSVTMFVGAAIAGVLTALLTQWIHKLGKVEESASMGVVFTTLFAIGLIFIVRAADAVDLDPGCVLYGAIELTPIDTCEILGYSLPRAFVNLSGIFLIDVLFVLFFYKELRISSFDPSLSTTLGINANLMHYLLMTLIAVTTVASFESVGSILVIAMLIVPAAASHLLTDRYLPMLLVSVFIAGGSAALGHLSAITVPTWFGYSDTSTAGMMAVTVGLVFFVTLLLAPRHGIISKLAHRTALSLRITREDILGLLYRLEESRFAREIVSIPSLLHESLGSSTLIGRVALMNLQRRQLIQREGNAYRLTFSGKTSARKLVRAHRLWESYLAKHLNLPSDHLHDSASRTEHFITRSMDQEMARDLNHITTDPHGQEIPEDEMPSTKDHEKNTEP